MEARSGSARGHVRLGVFRVTPEPEGLEVDRVVEQTVDAMRNEAEMEANSAWVFDQLGFWVGGLIPLSSDGLPHLSFPVEVNRFVTDLIAATTPMR